MKNTLFAVCIILISNCAFTQKSASQIEITSYISWDKYPSFTYPTSSVMNTTIRLKSFNWGLQSAIKFPIKNNFFVKFGLGYQKYYFNNIQAYTRLFGTQNSREINYPGGSSTFGYATDKYWYNTLSAIIGIEKLFDIKKNWVLINGLNITNYYTFSQRYILFSKIKYRESDSHYFGFSTNIYTGLQKKFKKVNIGPTLILPVYTNWKQDNVFPLEENNKSRNKWLRGIGVGITIIYSLKKP